MIIGQPDIIVAWLKANEVVLFASDRDESKALVVPATVVADMEVKNRDELSGLIKTWVSEHTYSKAEMVWIIDHELCFSETIESSKLDGLDSEVVKFLELLPFGETYSHVYDTSDGGKQVIAVNKSLIDAYRFGFGIQGYETRLVVPEIRLSSEIQKLGINKQLYKAISGKLNEISREKIIDENLMSQRNDNSSDTKTANKPQAKSQLKLLLIVFGVLLLVLGLVIYLTYFK